MFSVNTWGGLMAAAEIALIGIEMDDILGDPEEES